MTTETFNVGDGHIARITLYDLSNAEADPTALSFTLLKPDGTTIDYTDADAELVRDSAGKYHVELTYDQKGRHTIKWVATGNIDIVETVETYVVETR